MTDSPPEAQERLLIEEAQRDPKGFAELYERNFERVYAYVARRAESRAEAEDITAEAFHQALAKIVQFKWRGVPFAGWVMRIAANALADRWKRVARESGRSSSSEAADEAVDIEEVEEQARAFRAVKFLPPEQRRVIELRFAEEKSIAEIAEAMGKTQGAVKQLQLRALRNLRAKLGEADE